LLLLLSPLVELQNITKRFPNVIANDRISLTLRGGEIHTLLGENGAGKSTLMNILSGMLPPDAGKILVQGQPVQLTSPQQALKHGIGTVYQHFTLVSNLSVLENIILGADSGFILDLGRAEQRLHQLWQEFGLSVSPQVEVQHLSLGQQQRIEIMKALYRGSQVLLLDEPTSVLTPPEVLELFGMLRRLRANGVAVVFITHKLDEALALSDRITILRQGRWVGELGPDELGGANRAALTQRIVALLFGSHTAPAPTPAPDLDKTPLHSQERPRPNPIFSLDQVTVLNDQGTVAVRQLSLNLWAGQIFGLAGVDGNGQKELAEAIAGQRWLASGQIRLNGTDMTNKGVNVAQQAGIGYVTDERLAEGSVAALSVAENLVLKEFRRPPFARWALLNRPAIAVHAQQLVQQFKIKTAGIQARVATLSGGNVQKLLLARELAAAPKVLVCSQPTQGLDALTTQFVLQSLRAQADQGAAILLISAELEELLAWSDRLGVMYNGRLVELLPQDQANRDKIGRLMLGVSA
jgi:simple sugar transport system ATP-binding protein